MSRGSHCMRCGLLCNVFERDGQRIYVCPGAHGQQHTEPIPEIPKSDIPESTAEDAAIQQQAADLSKELRSPAGNPEWDFIPFGWLPGSMQEGLIEAMRATRVLKSLKGVNSREQLTKLIDLIALHENDSEDEGDSTTDASQHGTDTGAAPGGDLRPPEVGTGADPGQGETAADDSNLERVAGVSGSE